MIQFIAGLATATLWLAGVAAQEPETSSAPLLLRGATISEQFVVFSYAGDLWRVSRDGGAATRVTDGPADDAFPTLSPDGTSIAFSRRGADDWDVYVVPVQGGQVRRLTWNPEADVARGWSPDGARILFMSHRDEKSSFRLYTIATDGTFPRSLDLPRGWDGSFSPTGERLAYVPVALPLELVEVDWRHYRGGLTSAIWILDLANAEIERVPREDSNDRDPIWIGNALYFVSDRSGVFNLHRYGIDTRQVTQVTDYRDFGIETASGGPGGIAFVRDGRIHTYDVVDDSVRELDVSAMPDSSELRPRTVAVGPYIQSAAPSPDGTQVIMGARGEVVLFDVGDGTARNLTETPGVAERYPLPSPDGQWVAFFSDETGDYELRLRSLADGETRRIPVELASSFYRELTWSPDSKHIAFSDRRLTLWVADAETGGARRVTTSTYSDQDRYYPAWSPDGRWLAYSRYEPNRVRAIYVYEAERGRRVRVTGARVHASHPVFDRNGRYLYFVASNDAPLADFGWPVLSGALHRPLVTRRLQVAVLRPGDTPPTLPITGEPLAGREAGDSPRVAPPGRPMPRRGRPPAGARPEPGPRQFGSDMEGIETRIVPLPLPARDFAGLAAGRPNELYVLLSEWPPAPGGDASPTRSLYRYELSKPQELQPLVMDIDDFSVSAGGEHVLYRRDDAWAFVPEAGVPASEDGVLDLGGVSIDVDPAAEWRQIYHEAWRLMRDYFYDPDHHGFDVADLERHYRAYLPAISRRQDLNLLLGRGLGHISVGHLRVRGGDLPQPATEPGRVGLLGADYQVSRGRYRIARIYRSGHFNDGNPLLRAPLDQPGVRVSEGDYLLAVDGEQVTVERNIYSYFEGKALRSVEITVSSLAEDAEPQTFRVVPLPSENLLRRMNWAERNRRLVEEETRGVVGYVWVPSFSSWGIEMIYRQLLESTDRRGLIIDQRFAGGGITADALAEFLGRRPLYYYAFREGEEIGVPTSSVPAAKVLLINELNASAAETFAMMFKLGRLGPSLGARTWGAGIGPYGFTPDLIDGGRLLVPNRAAFDPAGEWAIENSGVQPDIPVEWMPREWRRGRDPQLEAAINTALQTIVDNPPLEVTQPAFPVYGPQGSEEREGGGG